MSTTESGLNPHWQAEARPPERIESARPSASPPTQLAASHLPAGPTMANTQQADFAGLLLSGGVDGGTQQAADPSALDRRLSGTTTGDDGATPGSTQENLPGPNYEKLEQSQLGDIPALGNVTSAVRIQVKSDVASHDYVIQRREGKKKKNAIERSLALALADSPPKVRLRAKLRSFLSRGKPSASVYLTLQFGVCTTNRRGSKEWYLEQSSHREHFEVVDKLSGVFMGRSAIKQHRLDAVLAPGEGAGPGRSWSHPFRRKRSNSLLCAFHVAVRNANSRATTGSETDASDDSNQTGRSVGYMGSEIMGTRFHRSAKPMQPTSPGPAARASSRARKPSPWRAWVTIREQHSFNSRQP